MNKKIYGVTVGTPLSPAKIAEKLKPVKTVNGIAPDENGNVNVQGGGIAQGGGGIAQETDPTVPAWAKQPNKPVYTADEVGALPSSTVIPTVPTKVSAFENDKGYLTAHQDLSGYANKSDIPTALPNPHALTFTGAVSATYDGSKAVSIEIPSGGGSGGGGSGGASYSWQTEPTTEEVTEIVYTLGNTIELANKIVNADSMRLYVYLVAPSAESTDATESGSVTAGIYIPSSLTWGWQAVKDLKVAPIPSVAWSLTAEIESVLLQAGKKINDIAALSGWARRSGIMLTTGYPKNKNPIYTTPFISSCGINKNSGNGMREISLKVTSTTPLGVGSYMRLECYNSSGV